MSRLVHLLYAPFKWLWNFGAPKSPASAPKEKTASTPSLFDDLGTQMQNMRDSLRTMGGAFAAAAGVVVGGLGYARIHDAFPFPTDGASRPLRALVVGAFLALGGAAWFSGRFFAAQRRIPMQSKEVNVDGGLTDAEKALRHQMFAEAAHAEDASSLEALELRANRLDRVSRRLPEGPSRASMEKEVVRIVSALRLTFRETAAAILERRAQDVYYGWPTKAAIASFIVGVVLLFGVADWSKGERDLIGLRAQCAEAELKGAPDACKPVRTEHSSPSPLVAAFAEATERRLGAMRTDRVVSCLRRVLRLKAIRNRTQKEIISAAITLCGEPTG